MSNPFQLLNAAAHSIEEIRSLRVDREREFSQTLEALVKRSHNVLLYGRRGAGKTFLVRLLDDEIRRTESNVFPCIVNLASLAGYDNNDEVSAFPRAVLLQLCAAMWTQLLEKPYLDLRDRLTETGQELTFRGTDERTIQNVYKHLVLQQLISKSSLSNTAGISLVAKGEKSEAASLEAKHAPILPFEFAEFVAQLIKAVLIPRGKARIIVLCDESNHIKLCQQEQILSRYLELFSAKRVQFVFVAGIGPWNEQEYVPSCFETTLKLEGFQERSHVQSLISAALTKAQRPQITFAPETVDVLFESFAGHPRRTVLACQKAYDLALDSTLSIVDLRLMLRVCRQVEEREREYEQSIRKYMSRDG